MINEFINSFKNITTKEKSLHQEIIDSISTMVIKLDSYGNIVYFNERFKTMMCFETDYLLTKKFIEFLNIENLNLFNKYITQARLENLKNKEIYLFNKFEETIYLNININYIPKNDEYIITMYDITQEKENEIINEKNRAKLAIESRINTVSEMLENIAHQWRQPLSAISMSASGIQVNLDYNLPIEDIDLKKSTQVIMEQCRYLTKTIEDFRNMFMSNTNTFQIHQIKNIIYKILNLVKYSFETNTINVNVYIDDNIFIKVDESALFQALINIFNNVKDAFLEREISSKDRYFTIKVQKFKNDVIMTFTDTAGGISEENIEKIFEPYFTTKHKSVGTGIGLHMTHQIITKHLNGTIEVKNKTEEINNQKYKGASFKIVLPVND